MKKIVFVAANESCRWGGSELCWSLVAENLARRGTTVTASVKDWNSPVTQVEKLRSAGCRVFLRRQSPLALRAARRIFKSYDFHTNHLRRFALDANLVVISQGGHTDGLLWMEACRKLGLQYAVIAQAASEHWWPEDGVATRLATSYEHAVAAYFVSESNLALSRIQFATGLKRAKVIRNPFNVSYDAHPGWPSNAERPLHLACIARLEVAAKGQDLLLGVLALPHWRGRDIQLSFAGRGVNERALRSIVEALKLPNVNFLGFVEGIEEFWSRHHILVLPSRIEGLPLALVEAMLCNRPAVVTNVAGNPEVVVDGANGFIARAPTVEFLDEAMNRAWNARTKLQEIGFSAGKTVRELIPRDPVKEFADELLDLLE
jgi:glycosyltransferase involved in cell wall biosynthesis